MNRVHKVFEPMVQKLLNINLIIENSMKSKQKVWGNWGVFLILLESLKCKIY
jgi:hypothetical protein